MHLLLHLAVHLTPTDIYTSHPYARAWRPFYISIMGVILTQTLQSYWSDLLGTRGWKHTLSLPGFTKVDWLAPILWKSLLDLATWRGGLKETRDHPETLVRFRTAGQTQGAIHSVDIEQA